MPYFVCLINTSAEKSGQVINSLKKLTAPKGGKIHSRRALMGPYDFLIEFEAPDENVALDWVVNEVRAIPGVTSTQTFVTRELV
jgi:uncharacterized protein with GYD domain